jgi:hypothetical protein
MSLNGKPAAAQFVLEPKDFNNGVAVIRAKAEKSASTDCALIPKRLPS